jgi:hypothetical protein
MVKRRTVGQVMVASPILSGDVLQPSVRHTKSLLGLANDLDQQRGAGRQAQSFKEPIRCDQREKLTESTASPCSATAFSSWTSTSLSQLLIVSSPPSTFPLNVSAASLTAESTSSLVADEALPKCLPKCFSSVRTSFSPSFSSEETMLDEGKDETARDRMDASCKGSRDKGIKRQHSVQVEGNVDRESRTERTFSMSFSSSTSPTLCNFCSKSTCFFSISSLISLTACFFSFSFCLSSARVSSSPARGGSSGSWISGTWTEAGSEAEARAARNSTSSSSCSSVLEDANQPGAALRAACAAMEEAYAWAEDVEEARCLAREDDDDASSALRLEAETEATLLADASETEATELAEAALTEATEAREDDDLLATEAREEEVDAAWTERLEAEREATDARLDAEREADDAEADAREERDEAVLAASELWLDACAARVRDAAARELDATAAASGWMACLTLSMIVSG